jgi:hypothetical protein
MRAPRSANSRMVAVPMTPAAPVTTATLPSRRIRSGIRYVSSAVPVVPDFWWLDARAREPLTGLIISFVDWADQWPEPAANRPFPAVFNVLTEWTAIGG